MVLPINIESTVDAIAKMGQASASFAQGRSADANALTQMTELKEFTSDTQKKLREAKAQAEISKANADKIESDVVNNNPDLVRSMKESGMQAQLQKHLLDQGQTFNERILNNWGAIEKDSSPEAIQAMYKNTVLNDPTSLQGLPSLDQLMKDPTQVDRLKLMVAAASRNRSEFMQRSILQKEEGEIRGGLQEDAQTFEAGEAGKQRQFQAGQSAADRGFRSSEAAKERDFIAGESHLKMDWTSGENAMDRALKRDIAELDYQAALAKAKAAQKDKVPKVADVMGETTTNFKKYTAPQIVDRVLEEKGLELGVDLKNQLAFEASNQALGDWDRAIKKGETPDHPGIMVEKLVDYYVASGRIKKGEGWFTQGEIAEADAAMIKNVGGRSSESLKRARSNYNELIKEPEFRQLNPMEKEKVLRRVMGQ